MLKVNNLAGFGKKRPAAGSSYDSDAQAFFTASGVTDTTQKDAVNALVLALKAASIWTKMTAVYPFVGGDATKHSYNLKTPGSYQITWNGTVTHNANGITSNGSDGYGNTGLVPSTHLTEDDTHLSLYSRTNSVGNVYEMAAISDAAARWLALQVRASGDNVNFYCYNSGSTVITVTNTDGQGFYVGSRRGNADSEAYKNGSSIGTNTASDTQSRPTVAIFICCRNNSGTPQNYSPKNIAFASLGAGLTDAEVTAFNTAVETFQDALSRGVV